MENIVSMQNICLAYEGVGVFENLDFEIKRGQNYVIGGKSGSGKSSFGKLICGKIKPDSGSIKTEFNTRNKLPATAYYMDNWYKFSSLDGDRNFYYQQRYDKQEDDTTLTVYAELMRFGEKHGLDFENAHPLLEKFGFLHCKETQLIELSSGEHKKLQLTMALWYKPQLLVLDEPYTGLDKNSRQVLNDVLDAYSKEGLTYILITADGQLPKSAANFGKLENKKFVKVATSQELNCAEVRIKEEVPYFLQLPPKCDCTNFINIKNVSVRYGEKTVLSGVNWQVNKGEKWLLQGSNGSGKSTLLSLLDGDHPQAYANDITLFEKPRGSGESIWDIKKKIGIISPELHWYFEKNSTVYNSVASGFHDSIGWFLDVSYDEQKKIELLLKFFGIYEYKDRYMYTLPLGKQRLALLARTMVKNPPLLILDEPCQGLDNNQTQLFNDALDDLGVYGKTIIYVGHYETQLPKCIDHKLVLEKGKTVYCGKV